MSLLASPAHFGSDTSLQYPFPCPGPFAHLVLHGSRQEIDRVLVATYFPATTKRPVDLDQVGGNIFPGRGKQILLLGISAEGTDNRVEINQTILVLRRGGGYRSFRRCGCQLVCRELLDRT